MNKYLNIIDKLQRNKVNRDNAASLGSPYIVVKRSILSEDDERALKAFLRALDIQTLGPVLLFEPHWDEFADAFKLILKEY